MSEATSETAVLTNTPRSTAGDVSDMAMAAERSERSRHVVVALRGQAASDGAGVRLTRMLGTNELPDLDPFLMLDQFRSDSADDYVAGFPEHPHRGFETVTVMLAGRMRHADNRGNEGVIEPGGVQWMTAGRGIVHSEMPEQADGLLWGFQLWLNLPSSRKMVEPGYGEFDATSIPIETRDGVRVRVIAGTTDGGTTGPATAVTDPLLLDVHLDAGATFDQSLPYAHNAFAAVYAGAIEATDAEGAVVRVRDPELAVMSRGERVSLVAGPDGARFLLAAAQPIGEPIARHGPFVMNTQDELVAAFRDFRAGAFG